MTVAPRRSDLRGAARLCSHVLLLTGGALATHLMWGTWWTLVTVTLTGVVLSALFCTVHECSHRTAFRSRRVNDVVAAIAGVPLLLPSRWFRLFHAAHHRFTQDPARDPELQGRKPTGRIGIVVHASGLAYWWAMSRVIGRLVVGRADEPYVPPAHRPRVVREARVLATVVGGAVVVSVLARSWLVVQVWVVPALVGQPFLRAYLLAEHTGCPEVDDVLASTRTTTTNAVVRWLAWNMPYHAEHHTHPQVPFHQLPALHRTMVDDLRVVGHGYVRTYVQLQRARWRAARYVGRP